MTPSVASEADLDAIVALVNGAYRGASAQSGWTHEGELLGGQRTDVATLRAAVADGAFLLVMRASPKAPLLACVSVEPKGDGGWYLGMLTVDPEQQAGGIGRTMLEAGEAFARERGGRRIEMTVIQLREPLIAWYERRGYLRTGETAPFPYGDERFGQPMRPDLHFVVLAKPL